MITMSYEKRDHLPSKKKPPQCMIDVLCNQKVLDADREGANDIWAAGVPNQQSGYYTMSAEAGFYPMPNSVEHGTRYIPTEVSGKPSTLPTWLENLNRQMETYYKTHVNICEDNEDKLSKGPEAYDEFGCTIIKNGDGEVEQSCSTEWGPKMFYDPVADR